MRFGLNIRSDAMILRNRLERYEMRRHFGADAAPWNLARDEPTEESQPRAVVHAFRARRSKFFYSCSFTGERIWSTSRASTSILSLAIDEVVLLSAWSFFATGDVRAAVVTTCSVASTVFRGYSTVVFATCNGCSSACCHWMFIGSDAYCC